MAQPEQMGDMAETEWRWNYGTAWTKVELWHSLNNG